MTKKDKLRWYKLVHVDIFFHRRADLEQFRRYEEFIKVALQVRAVKDIKEITFRRKYRCIKFRALGNDSIFNRIKDFCRDEHLIEEKNLSSLS